MKPFRFGVNAWTARSPAEWGEKARQLEGLGYSTLCMPDHLAETLSPFSALAVAAEAAPRLRVGPFVLNNDLRHPVVIARELATLDLLSGGRVEVGLGAGYSDNEYRETGLRFDRGATRVQRLAESVEIIKRLFAGGAVHFEGTHYRIDGHCLYPLPVQRPRPPLLIGGNGQELLTLAAREADIVSFTGATFRSRGRPASLSGFDENGFGERVEWVRAAARARAIFPELNVLIQRVMIAETPRRAAEQVTVDFRTLATEAVASSPFFLLGPVDHIIDDLRERRERWGISYVVVFERSIDAFAPVVARLAGN